MKESCDLIPPVQSGSLMRDLAVADYLWQLCLGLSVCVAIYTTEGNVLFQDFNICVLAQVAEPVCLFFTSPCSAISFCPLMHSTGSAVSRTINL